MMDINDNIVMGQGYPSGVGIVRRIRRAYRILYDVMMIR